MWFKAPFRPERQLLRRRAEMTGFEVHLQKTFSWLPKVFERWYLKDCRDYSLLKSFDTPFNAK
jgi:hypothetical protein